MSILKQHVTENYAIYCGDCVEVWKELESDSLGFVVYSPPFSNLYIYSDSSRDMGNAADDAEFFKHYGYLLPEIYRTLIPGRLTAVHCKDLPLYRGRDGSAGLKDFPGQIIAAHEEAGFTYHSRVTIWKCPVTERERTNNNGLLHKTVCRDSSQIRQGMADYLLLFRKTPHGEDGNLSDQPISRPNGLNRWIGDDEANPLTNGGFHPSKFARIGGLAGKSVVDEETGETFNSSDSVTLWRRYAEPVWWDISQTDVLNFQMARSENDERHICPLQLGLIRRAIYLWSNEGDIVGTPFLGIGSEAYVAIQEKRKAVGSELKEGYFDYAKRHLDMAVNEVLSGTLFE